MFIPLRTNRPSRRRPRVTETLIVINLLVFLAGLLAEWFHLFDRRALLDVGHLGRTDFHAWQLVTYQFLHDPTSIWHIAFNMLFLWVFGAAVEDRLGRLSFLSFYLIGGAVAGIAHMMTTPAPVIGASGSVAAVSGAFLALFPRSRILVLVIFFIIGTYAIPATWFIAFYIVVDLVSQVGGGDGVAHIAHLAGYAYGFALAFLLLATKIVKREEFDIFFLFTQARRRAAFRAASAKNVGGMWESASADTERDLARRARKAKPVAPPDPEFVAARADVMKLIAERRLDEAAARYVTAVESHPTLVLPEPEQLDIANQLNAADRPEAAASAYERLLAVYPRCRSGPEVRLLLAALYIRKLAKPDAAREALAGLKDRLDDAQRGLAAQLQAELDA